MDDTNKQQEQKINVDTFRNGEQFLALRVAIQKNQQNILNSFRLLSLSARTRSLSNPDLNNKDFHETFDIFYKCFTDDKINPTKTIIKTDDIAEKVSNDDVSSESTKTTSNIPHKIVSTNSQQTQTDNEQFIQESSPKTLRNDDGHDDYCEIPLQTMPLKPDRKSSKRSVKSTETERTSSSSKCDNSVEYSETTATTTTTQPEEAIYAPSTYEDDDVEDEYDEFDDCDESSSGGYFERDSLPRPPLPTNSRFDALFRGKEIKDLPKNAASVKRRAKESFRQFMKINKIASNKLLSIRLRDAQGTLRKKIFSFAAFDAALHRVQRHKSRRPTREPPPPPILVFRPAAPEPALASSISQVGTSSHNKSFDDDTISELYHDSFLPENEDEEAIYSCVEETQPNEQSDNSKLSQAHVADEDPYDGTALSGSTYEMTGYYDDGECIYEELSSPEDDNGTVYEDYFDDEEEKTYGNVEDLKSAEQKEKEQTEKEIKRIKKMAKMMKKFHLQGDEVPINSGIIVSDRRGSRNNLLVRQGETVLIIRMEGNPPGKWLAKNERSKLGYVDPDNVVFDTESIAAVIKSFHNL